MASLQRSSGIVFLVGAGPGDPGLITRRGADLVTRAEVVIYDGLVAHQLVALAPAAAERIYAGKKHHTAGTPRSQAEINALLVERARAGKRVVRLKGGDPFVFGRGAEECAALAAAGIAFEIVPGVSAATAVCAYAGIPLTARSVASTVALATGHEAAGKPTEDVDWEALARAGTVLLFMACATIDECASKLIAAGRAADDPAAAIRWGTTAAQRTVTAPLCELASEAAARGLKPPVLIVVGPAVALRDQLSWHERRPLANVRVVLTRAADRGAAYAAAIADAGGEPDFCPVTRIAEPADSAPLEVAVDDLAAGRFAWLGLASANAVHAVVDALWKRGRDA
ncbi:MAG TPA: uroporphyrinogen-III C-methyltransferase, partial [Kofleriaceae bacterium]|nr:uroporphyrinogen-III C-methyltransferase [Kofleriaceae bacterium]